MKQNIHTVPTEQGWAVRQEGSNAPLSHHQKKADAVETGASLARMFGVEHIIHGKDGKIQDRDSYGNDPFPPRDTKH